MNECWKKSEVAPNQESGFLSELAKCAFAAALLHLWEPRNQDQTGPEPWFLGTKEETQVSGSPMNQKNGNPGN